MNFWSRGLGKRTIDLYVGKGEAHSGAEQLYVKGRVEAPVSWEYIMALRGEDLVDFFALLRDPAMADSIYRSPDRWRLLGKMLAGGIHVAFLAAAAVVRLAFGKKIELVELELPPPAVRQKKPRIRGRLRKTRPNDDSHTSINAAGH